MLDSIFFSVQLYLALSLSLISLGFPQTSVVQIVGEEGATNLTRWREESFGAWLKLNASR